MTCKVKYLHTQVFRYLWNDSETLIFQENEKKILPKYIHTTSNVYDMMASYFSPHVAAKVLGLNLTYQYLYTM